MGSSSQRKGGIKTGWGKHLRPYGKRQHWKRVRQHREREKPSKRRGGKKPWIIKMRYCFLNFDITLTNRYATERDMQNALRTMEDVTYAGHCDLL